MVDATVATGILDRQRSIPKTANKAIMVGETSRQIDQQASDV
jgi:hypothetical protein